MTSEMSHSGDFSPPGGYDTSVMTSMCLSTESHILVHECVRRGLLPLLSAVFFWKIEEYSAMNLSCLELEEIFKKNQVIT